MPVLYPTEIATFASSITARAGNESLAVNALQVVCAWPVSGQYGPGSRVLYYVLVAASILARKAEWLRNACLAAALLIPAVAALHGIVLAALHTDGAMDMDVYGAFQFCAIGVLAAPVTVKLSSTYFNDRGRNIIFLWTILLLAGLLSLTVEFYRSQPVDCKGDNGITLTASQFIYEATSCGLDYCAVKIPDGPNSPMRQGAGTDIYVIPAPTKLTFGTATLLAAGCCIPSILSLVSIWIKILETNWKSRFGPRDANEHIDGTKATEGNMRGVNEMVRKFLSVVEVPFFGAAVLAILILGENNLFSFSMSYGTEPIGSVGQWAPIVGTLLATIGSLYLLLAKNEPHLDTLTQHGTYSHHGTSDGRQSLDTSSIPSNVFESPRPMEEVGAGRLSVSPSSPGRDSAAVPRHSASDSDERSTSQDRRRRLSTNDVGNRRTVAEKLKKFAENVGTPSQDLFDISAFRGSVANDFPEIPGEPQRNPQLQKIRITYNEPREEDDSRSIRSTRPRSRAASFNGSTRSGFGVDRDGLTRSRTASPVRPRASPLTGERSSSEPQAPATDPTGTRKRARRDTLEVPSAAPRTPTRQTIMPAATVDPAVMIPVDTSSPVIVISNPEAPPSPNGLAIFLHDQPISSETRSSTESFPAT